MKTTFASALGISAAVAFVSVAAAPCNTTALAELTTTENVSTCSSDSGYSLTSMAMPSDAQITAFCNSDACQESLNAVKQVAPNECTIGSIRLYADVINPLSERCDMKSGSATAAGPMKTGSGPMDDDVGNATSPASACMAGSAMDQPNSTTPQPNTRPTTRSPSPNSSPVAAGNGGTDTPTLSMCAAIAVLATVVAAIL
ncbi:hypothetical protein KXD40_002763 [Peronospora effusa]|uniref:Elicitin n=1 Tax=Peronospora effusa TaxID=542832 RepID=A0A3M6VJ17_9STRA|nr:hypothetical protein DD238_003417 [Peronospora effusa]RQM16409.1 hypothetical protein DD237_003423 [Peronospora effusa]UIZ29437.1 hypothetical protein KXD40_002763 [Peronospora effusa]CAI5701527.1 unnamed protein product [Peronospora effusa]